MVRNYQVAQDIAQEAILRILQEKAFLSWSSEKQKAWSFRVVHNLCVDHIKRTALHHKFSDGHRGEIIKFHLEEPTQEKKAVDLERWGKLNALLDQLTLDQKTVILLFFEEDMSYKEIADTTGFSSSNVGMLLHRGLKKLRPLIEKDSDLMADLGKEEKENGA